MKNQVNIVNKRAKFEYEFIRTEVGGIMLMGSEVKSIRDGKISLSESFCTFINGELFLRNANITITNKNALEIYEEYKNDKKN